MAPKAPQYVDLDTAARLARVTRRTIQNKLSDGGIPASAVTMNRRQKLVSMAALRAIFGELEPFHELHHQPRVKKGEVHGNEGETTLTLQKTAEALARAERAEAIAAELRQVLEHERADREREREDRERERQSWKDAVDRMSLQLVAVKGADYARDMARISEGKTGQVVDVDQGQSPVKAPTPKAKPPRPRYRAQTKTTPKPTAPTTPPKPGAWAWARRMFGR